MNKLDLRDYLYHGYGVRALSVRSFIKQRPVEANREGSNRREYFRRQAIKFMTVEMDEPFIWPKKPDNFDAYVFLYGYFGRSMDADTYVFLAAGTRRVSKIQRNGGRRLWRTKTPRSIGTKAATASRD
jgi:hypothetical protein